MSASKTVDEPDSYKANIDGSAHLVIGEDDVQTYLRT